MFDLEDAVAFAMFTADTADASRRGWEAYPNRDKYQRMARVAIRVVEANMSPHTQWAR